MASIVSSIGILDINYSSISVLDKLSVDYPNEVIYYLNDFKRKCKFSKKIKFISALKLY